VGGIKSLIQHGQNGLLVKPADGKGLAGAILGLLGDVEKREFLGNNARAFISQNFSQDKMAQETEGVYLECLNAAD
jgi:glycosyltransferase involved in cell wall biosynthesis